MVYSLHAEEYQMPYIEKFTDFNLQNALHDYRQVAREWERLKRDMSREKERKRKGETIHCATVAVQSVTKCRKGGHCVCVCVCVCVCAMVASV